jgi:hypothetical protein
MITTEVVMDLMEVTEKERLSREAAAERLHASGSAHDRRDRLQARDRDEERELEIELKW